MTNNPTHQQAKTIDDLIRFDSDTHDKKCGVTITRDLGNCDCNKTELIAALSAMVDTAIGRNAYIDYSQRDLYGKTQIAELEAINSEKDLQRKIAVSMGFNIGGKE